ncbi:MAG: hypothetical protein JWM80_1349 [Cyanobacteria bacterium RYN_339]|nr:hypothetical protein [Cyanobacteria bacterium RYN_339]
MGNGFVPRPPPPSPGDPARERAMSAGRPPDPQDPLPGEVARVERATGFVRSRIAALRAQLAVAPTGEALELLRARLETLEQTARGAEAVVREAVGAAPERALELVRGYDYQAMLNAMRGVELQAQRLTTPRRARPATATGPIAQAPRQTGQLTDRLRSLFAPPPRPVPPTVVAPTPEQIALEALEAAVRFMDGVLGYVDPRIAPVACALDVGDQAPGAPVVVQLALARRKAEAEVLETMRGWVPPLVRLFVERPPVRRPARVATTQWSQAHELRRHAEWVRQLARVGEPAKVRAALADIRAGKLRGAVMPLGNLHFTFAGVPHLQDLFPMPKQKGGPAPGGTAPRR